MNNNLIGCFIEAFAFVFMSFALVMQHIALTSGVIADSVSTEWAYNLNYSAIMIGTSLIASVVFLVRHDQEYYRYLVIGNMFVIALCTAHVTMLFADLIYEPWYPLATLGYFILLIMLFMTPIKRYVTSLKE